MGRRVATEVLTRGVDRAADVHPDDVRPQARRDLDKSAGAASSVQHPTAAEPLGRPLRLGEEAVTRQRRSVPGIELLATEAVPLVAERRGVAVGFDESGDPGADRIRAVAARTAEQAGTDVVAIRLRRGAVQLAVTARAP